MTGTRRILIVDDDAQVAFLMYHALDKLSNKGYEVHRCTRGEVAQYRLERERFDLVVTDLCMPGMHGLELVHHVVETSPQTRVLAITAYGSPEMEVMVRRLGADYLTKPFEPLEFMAAVERTLAEPSGEAEGD